MSQDPDRSHLKGAAPIKKARKPKAVTPFDRYQAEAPAVNLQQVALADLQEWPDNPKKHDIDVLRASIRRFGFVAPVIRDETTGRIVAGHGRVEALLRMKEDGEAAPANVAERDGDWVIPVLTGLRFKTEKEAEAYLIADNRLVELGGWDQGTLYDMLAGLEEEARAAIGYLQHDFEALQRKVDLNVHEFKKMDEELASKVKQVQCPHCQGMVPV